MLSSFYLSWVFGMSTSVEFVPGVFIILSCGLAFTAWIIYYILKLAYEEMKDETPESHSIPDKSEH